MNNQKSWMISSTKLFSYETEKIRNEIEKKFFFILIDMNTAKDQTISNLYIYSISSAQFIYLLPIAILNYIQIIEISLLIYLPFHFFLLSFI